MKLKELMEDTNKKMPHLYLDMDGVQADFFGAWAAKNNVGNYKSDTTKYRFRINARDKYPARSFTTSSIYNVNKALPQASYWSLYDLKSEEVIVDFDTTYTKISCDATSSYFDLYMVGLEPERYYKILIKTVLPTGESIDVDNDYIFKIIR